MQVPDQTVLVAASQRTGSTMLCRALADTGVVGRPEEYFLAIDERVLPDFGCWENADHAPSGLNRREYLAWVYQVGTTPNGVFAAKLMWDQLDWVVRKFQGLDEFAGLDLASVFRRAFPGLQFVVITRRDRLAQAISWARASQDWVWVVSDDEPARPRATPRYDRRLITDLLGLIPRAERGWRQLAVRLGCSPIEVAYEDLLDDLGGQVARLLAELGLGDDVDTAVDTASLRARTIRQSDEVNAEWRERYEAGR